jgi:hypothetical protein
LIALAVRAEGRRMLAERLMRHILQDEALTRGLGDAEARVLIEWLVDWAELLAEDAESEDDAWKGIKMLCRRGRGIGRFVELWLEPETRGAATQLAGSERFHWPLPVEDEEPAELMSRILTWEDRQILI